MTSSVSPVGQTKPAVAWALSRLSSLDPWSRSDGGVAPDGTEGPKRRAPVAPGVSLEFSNPSQAEHRLDEGLRGWIEDRLLQELVTRILPPHQQPMSPGDHVNALRGAVLQLEGSALHADAMRVLKETVAGHETLWQGRCALQGV